jgi:hypothetical protein
MDRGLLAGEKGGGGGFHWKPRLACAGKFEQLQPASLFLADRLLMKRCGMEHGRGKEKQQGNTQQGNTQRQFRQTRCANQPVEQWLTLPLPVSTPQALYHLLNLTHLHDAYLLFMMLFMMHASCWQ